MAEEIRPCSPIDFRVVRISQYFDTFVPVLAVVGYLMTQSCIESFFVALTLTICLRMIRNRSEVIILRSRQNFLNNLTTNCGPLPVNKNDGIPYRTIPLSESIVATYDVDLFVVETVRGDFE